MPPDPAPPPVAWHALETAEVAARLGVDPAYGLDETEAARRLAADGPNALVEGRARGLGRIVAAQFASTIVAVLLAAAAISLALGERADAVAIVVIVLLNAALGAAQERRAERALEALRALATPSVRVRRGGTERRCPATELVRGDVVLLEAGLVVPADGRVVESAGLQLQEAALTGESQPVEKASPAMAAATPLAERAGMAWRGTAVTRGTGALLVTATGMRTELGRIARLMHEVEAPETPLQRRLAHLGRQLAAAALVIVALVLALGLALGEEPRAMLLTSLSLAVAIIPEGLPAVATITLALGAQRMLRRQALIRRLPAVEALGSVTTICADKTGTLTQNRLTVAVLDVAGHELDLEELLRPAPRVQAAPPALPRDELRVLLAAGALCNDAAPVTGRDGTPALGGDPTDVALATAAAFYGLDKRALDTAFPRVGALPFDSERRRMTTIHRVGAGAPAWWPLAGAAAVAVTKGAVDALVPRCTAVLADGALVPLDDRWRARIAAAQDRLAGAQRRVLGVAMRPLADAADPAPEEGLAFVGLVGFVDPPRPEALDAVRTCRAAGITPVMITGDHPLTASRVAAELGIADDGRVVTGDELERTPPEALPALVAGARVYARVLPEQKLRIVEALQARGEIVAMTGDGVNDAPALRRADIGVAMGLGGTDVAKEAGAMVLLDDNFATIVAAVREGRVIFDNLRRFVTYILASNSGEVLTVLLALLAGMPLPLLPLQILWINLVTDGLPALALGLEPGEPGVMRRPPRPPREPVLDRELTLHVAWAGVTMAALTLLPAWHARRAGSPDWQTLAFTTLTLAQMGHALAIRSRRASFFTLGARTNPHLLAAVGLTLALQVLAIYWAPLQQLLHTRPLPAAELGVAVLAASGIFWLVELEKLLRRRADRRHEGGR